MLVIDTRIKLLLFILINFMVFGLKDFILGSVCFFFICILSCLMGQKKIVLKYLVFYVVIAAIQQLCIYLPQAIETILSIFTLFIRVMIPVVLFASTFIATTKVSELIAAIRSERPETHHTFRKRELLRTRHFRHGARKSDGNFGEKREGWTVPALLTGADTQISVLCPHILPA